MTRTDARLPGDFDYAHAPASYFDHLDPGTLVVASILGEERRQDVQARLASGDFDPLVWGEWLTECRLDEGTRELIGRAHPCFMGGEYLPSFEEDEIEIARIVMRSVMQDVISVRARRSGRRIAYRVADEYEGRFELARKSSARPLSMKELIALIDRSNHEEDAKQNGLVFSVLDCILELEADTGPMRNFIAVDSSFYPELGRYYREAIARYLDNFEAMHEEKEEAA